MNKKIFLGISILFLLLSGCSLTEKTTKNQNAAMNSDKSDKTEITKEKGSMNNEITENNEIAEYIDATPAEAKELIDNMPDLIIIDVSPNYANGHLPGAINYYVGDGSLDKAIPTLDKEATYLVYCHVDSAAILGAQKLIDAGFENVFRLEGNYAAWVDAGYPIEK